MKGLKFEDSKGRLVKVENVENNIAILNNGERVSVERLTDPSFYKQANGVNESHNNMGQNINESNNVVETHNPSPDQSTSRYEKMLEGINGGGSNRSNTSISIGDDGDINLSPVNSGRYAPSSQVKMSGDVVERRDHNTNNNSVVETHRSTPLSAEEKEKQLLEKYGQQTQQTPPPKKDKEKIGSGATLEDIAYGDQKDKGQKARNTQKGEGGISYEPQVEEIKGNKVYDNAKKTHSLKVDLKIDEKIPNKTVFKFLEDNFDFDESPIDYYSKYIFRKLMEDPKILENQIKKSIEKYIKGRKTNSKS